MLPSDLKPELFNGYPPEARRLVLEYLPAFKRLPLAFLSGLLREIIDYDFRFPAERKALERELSTLSSLSADETKEWFQGFAEIPLSPKLEQFDWVNAPAQFVEQLSAHLWSTHQLDSFRKAAIAYAEDSAQIIFGSATGNVVADQILRSLRAQPDGVGLDAAEQHALFGGHCTAAELRAAHDLLAELGLAETVTQPTGGRPRTITFLC